MSSRVRFTLAASGFTLALGFGFGGPAQAATVFSYSGAETTFIAPVAGVYEITAFGAAAGTTRHNGHPIAGGLGAEIGGDLTLADGEILTILVGGSGFDVLHGSNNNDGGGGGGGSFVALGSTPLVVAGGGGGGGTAQGESGLTGTSGGAGGASGGAGGTAGSGGGAAPTVFGGAAGGGGFFGDGGSSTLANGGVAFVNGGGVEAGGPGQGGFGGGGDGAPGTTSGGGGGGYSGGGGGSEGSPVGGGGGGSYIDAGATHTFAFSGVQSGDGEVDITLLSAVPEPSAWAMLLLGFGVLGVAMRKVRGNGLPAKA